MSEELVKIQPSTPALPSGDSGESSWGEDSEAVRPRYIQIKNPKSVTLEDFKNGYFVDKEIDRQWPEIEIVILALYLSRRRKTPYQAGVKSTLLCRSINRVVPVKDDPRFKPLAESCDICPHGRLAWANYDKETKSGKPDNPCDSDVELLFIIKTNPNQPYIYQAQNNAKVPMEALNSKLRNRALDVKAETGRMPFIYEYVVKLKTERNKSGNYIPLVAGIRELTAEEAKEFGPVYQQFVVTRNAQFEAQKQARLLEARTSTAKVVETAAQPVTKPVINAEYLPPVKKTTAAKPVYVPPVIDVEIVEGDLTAVDGEEQEQEPVVTL